MHQAMEDAKLVTVVSGLFLTAWGGVALFGGQAAHDFLMQLLAHLPH